MTARRIAVLVLLLAVTAVAPASPAPPTGYYYLNPRLIDLTILLPPPPDPGSPEARVDMRDVSAAVAARSPSELLEARETSERTVFFFAPSIGSGFTAERLPLTAAFFARVSSDVKRIIASAKQYWERPRPDGAAKKHGSYPSGHAAFASSTAIVLSQLLPEKRDAIFSQARVFAANRILLGLHYPTDVASGWTAGTLAAYVMMHDPAFRRDFARVRDELRRAHVSEPTPAPASSGAP
jgi:acid phosphatase (class A)